MRRQAVGHFGIAAAGVACAFTARADPPSALDPNPYSVIRPEQVAPFFAAARQRRVDIAIIGDSNTRHNLTSGHEDGMARGFTARYGCYATRVDPIGGVGGWAAPTFESTCTQLESITVGAPAELLGSSLSPDIGFPFSYAYLPVGTLLNLSNNSGLGINSAHPVQISGPLRWHGTQWVFPTALPSPPDVGFVSLCCREQWPGSAWNNYSTATLATTSIHESGWQDWHLDVPAGPRSPHGVLFCLTNIADNSAAVGPFFTRWNRVENLATQAGIAYSPLLYQGGQTTRDAAIALVSLSQQSQMTEWFRLVVRLQNGEPKLLIQIIQGANDCNHDYPALVYERGDPPRALEDLLVGPPTNTQEGLHQNLMSVINRLRDFWTGAGYDESNLYFLIGCYHPHPPSWNESVPGADDGPQYRIMREEARPAWLDISTTESNVTLVDGWLLSTPEEFIANGWYRYHTPSYRDHAHLSTPGFTAWGEAVAEAVKRACDCGPSVDFDLNGAREVSDIFAFLSLWFAADPRANFDQLGDAPTVPDIFAFLSAWFAGCAGH